MNSKLTAHGIGRADGRHHTADLTAVAHLVDGHASALQFLGQRGAGGKAHSQNDVIGGDRFLGAVSRRGWGS